MVGADHPVHAVVPVTCRDRANRQLLLDGEDAFETVHPLQERIRLTAGGIGLIVDFDAAGVIVLHDAATGGVRLFGDASQRVESCPESGAVRRRRGVLDAIDVVPADSGYGDVPAPYTRARPA